MLCILSKKAKKCKLSLKMFALPEKIVTIFAAGLFLMLLTKENTSEKYRRINETERRIDCR